MESSKFFPRTTIFTLYFCFYSLQFQKEPLSEVQNNNRRKEENENKSGTLFPMPNVAKIQLQFKPFPFAKNKTLPSILFPIFHSIPFRFRSPNSIPFPTRNGE